MTNFAHVTSYWETQRVQVRDGIPGDAASLVAIFEENSYISEWTGATGGTSQESLAGALRGYARSLGYERMQLEVSVKNWPALRFWMGRGFTKLLHWRGDRTHSSNTFASVVLEKQLDA